MSAPVCHSLIADSGQPPYTYAMIELKVFNSKRELATAAADLVLATALEALALRGQFLWALSGGGTPQGLYETLVQAPYREQFPWAETHFFWGDERAVPPDDQGSNYLQAKLAIFDQVVIPAENIHRIPGELTPEWGALAYAGTLALTAGPAEKWPKFDLILMGMGGDGHTASLFPGQYSEVERTMPAMAVTANYQDRPANRVSLTPMILNQARKALFLVTGRSKAEALAAVLEGDPDPLTWPAQRIQLRDGTTHWYTTDGAADLLRG